MIWSLLMPCPIFSRIWFFRSIASGAFESAMVWFWHTRQRRSCASVVTRFSSADSVVKDSAARAVPPNVYIAINATRMRLRIAVQFSHQGENLVAHNLGSDHADALVADDAFLVDQKRLRHAVDAVIDPDATVVVVRGESVGNSELGKPPQAVLALVLVVEPDERHHLGAGQFDQHRMLLAAGPAPGRPDVEQPH